MTHHRLIVLFKEEREDCEPSNSTWIECRHIDLQFICFYNCLLFIVSETGISFMVVI